MQYNHIVEYLSYIYAFTIKNRAAIDSLTHKFLLLIIFPGESKKQDN